MIASLFCFAQGFTGIQLTLSQSNGVSHHINGGSGENDYEAPGHSSENHTGVNNIMSKDCQDHTPKVQPQKVNEFADLRSSVDNAAYNLEHHQNNSGHSASTHQILDEVYGSALKGKSTSYRAAFVDYLDRKLDVDEKKASVLNDFAQENFDFLSNGKKRIQSRDLDGKASELGMMGRDIEQRLTQDLLDKQTEIEKSKHEGVFLGLGHKHGIDRKRLDKYDDKEYDKAASENVLKSVGTPGEWDRLTGGTPYRPGTEAMNRPQLQDTINGGAADGLPAYPSNPRLYSDQQQALTYVDEHFKKMSKTVPTYYGDYERVVTIDSMNKYARKHGADWSTISDNRDQRLQYNNDIARANPSDW